MRLMKFLYDYEEHFQVALEKGESEEAIAASLGSPSNVAKQYRAEYTIRRAETSESAPNIIRAIFASIGLGLFNLIIVLAPFIVIIALLIAFFAIAIALTVGGFSILLASIVGPVSSQYLHIPPELVLTTCYWFLWNWYNMYGDPFLYRQYDDG